MLIRDLLPDDANSIQDIATITGGFTIPSSYLIWMLSRTQKPFCKVQVDDDGNLRGYVLAIRSADPEEIFVWQIGLALQSRLDALRTATELFGSLFEAAVSCGVSSARCSVSPGSRLKMLQRIVGSVSAASMSPTGEEVVADDGTYEVEYVITRGRNSTDEKQG